MRLYLTEFSRVSGGLLMAIYAVLSYVVFRYRTEKKREFIYILQVILMMMIQMLLFLQMLLRTDDMRYLFFFSVQAVVILAAIILHRIIYPDSNRLVMNNMCLLLMISMAVLTRLSGPKAVRQFTIVVVSLVIAFFLPALIHRLRMLADFTWLYAAVGVAGLLVVLVLGRAIHGSNLNYSIGGLTFQPSEFIKIIFVFFLAAALSKARTMSHVAVIAAVAAAHVLILVLSKDLGAGLIYFVTFFILLYIASDRIECLAVCFLSGAAACVVAYRLFGHVRARVTAFLDPWSAIDGAGYQVTQSLFGISVGGPFGLGLYGGTPGTIPFVEQDFIFSAIAEELGIIFAVSLLLICLSTSLMLLLIAERIRDPFYRLLCAGFGVIYIFQVFLTVGGGVKFIPLTGVTLPLVSYGGTSVLTTIVMFGIVQGVVLIRAEEHRAAVERLKADAALRERLRRKRAEEEWEEPEESGDWEEPEEPEEWGESREPEETKEPEEPEAPEMVEEAEDDSDA